MCFVLLNPNPSIHVQHTEQGLEPHLRPGGQLSTTKAAVDQMRYLGDWVRPSPSLIYLFIDDICECRRIVLTDLL